MSGPPFAGAKPFSGPPRVAPGTRAEIGAVNALLARLIGLAARSAPPNVFTTLARHRRLFRRWLWFAGALMPGGSLPRAETELLILRVAHRCGSDYEWDQHVRIARRAGLSDEDIARVQAGPDAEGWTARRAALLRACDELHDDRHVSDATWTALREQLGEDRLLIEVCLLVGHYEMLAMTLNSLQVASDAPGR